MSVEASAETDFVNVASCSPGSVLDVGCGSGPMKAVLPHAWSNVGIDLSFAELQEARRLGRQNLVEAALSETYRVLKDGGTFAFIRPSATPFFPRDFIVGATLALSLGALPAMPQRFSKRFSFNLHTLEDAQLIVDSLYLPKVLDNRRLLAATRLTWMASFVCEVPLSISLTVAQKSKSGTS